MTLAQIRTAAKIECAGTGAGVSVSDFEIDNMINEIYIDWCLRSKCILTSITTPWLQGPYLDIRTIPSIVNPVGPLTILNNNNNLYVSDEGCRDVFDRMRLDSENWTGTPLFWDLIDPYRILFAPYYDFPVGTLTMGYYSYPSSLVSDSDVPVFASDVHVELIKGVVFRYLESLEEFSKAETWEMDFELALSKYTKRVQEFGQMGTSYVL